MTEQQKQELMQNPEAMKAEMERCKDARYFYNNYVRKEGEPELTQEQYDYFLNIRNESPISNRIRQKIQNAAIFNYPFTAEESLK